ncbi:MAG: hypothetical protein AAFO96_03665 [Bacteroidota bacterium]
MAILLNQPEGIIPTQGGCAMCFDFELENTDPTADCVVTYKVFVDAKLLYKGVVIPLEIRDPLTGVTSTVVKTDISHIVKTFPGFRTAPQPENQIIPLPLYTQFETTSTIRIEYNECCNGVEAPTSGIATFQVQHASCGCDDGIVLEDYRPGGTDTQLSAFVDGSFGGNRVCLSTQIFQQIIEGTFSASGWQVCAYLLPGTYTVRIDGLGPPGFGATINIDNEGWHCYDLYAALILGFAFYQPPDPSQVEVYFLNNATNEITEPVTFYVGFGGRECCCDTTIQFLNCLGFYQPMSVSCERERGLEINRKDYVPCEGCSESRPSRRIIQQSYKRSKTFYTRPMKPTKENVDLLEAFFTSSQYYLPNIGRFVLLEPRSIAIELNDGRIQIPFEVFSAKEIPVLINN